MTYNFKDKAANIAQNNRYMFAKTAAMFEYSGLPETIPSHELEKLLQHNGYAFITEVNGELYAFSGGLGGLQDVYGNPTEITVNNVALQFNEKLNLETDGVLIKNDSYGIGLFPLFEKHNSMLVENEINIALNGFNTRLQTFLSATDDKTKASAENYLENLINGDVGVIGSSPMFDGIKTHSNGGQQNNGITSLIEYQQYIKASLHNEIGLNANFNMKRERLTTGEVNQGDDILFPFVDSMMKSRLEAIEKINEKYGLEIEIDYGSVWNKKNKEMVDDIIEATGGEVTPEPEETTDESVNESADESTDESVNESADESADESTEENEPEEGDELSNIQNNQVTDNSSSESSSESLSDYSDDTEINDLIELLERDDLTEEEREGFQKMLERLQEGE